MNDLGSHHGEVEKSFINLKLRHFSLLKKKKQFRKPFDSLKERKKCADKSVNN